jgi:hypothetical protein
MQITLQSMDGAQIAVAPITTDEHGYLYVNHPTFEFEFECALYGYQEGGVSSDTIDNDDGEPYIRWVVEA